MTQFLVLNSALQFFMVVANFTENPASNQEKDLFTSFVSVTKGSWRREKKKRGPLSKKVVKRIDIFHLLEPCETPQKQKK